MQFSITDEVLMTETQLENIMKIQKKQIILFTVLISWPLVPFLIAEIYSASTATSFVKGIIALGLGVFV